MQWPRGQPKAALKQVFVVYHFLLTVVFCRGTFSSKKTKVGAFFLPGFFSMFLVLGLLMLMEPDTPTPAAKAQLETREDNVEGAAGESVGKGKGKKKVN